MGMWKTSDGNFVLIFLVLFFLADFNINIFSGVVFVLLWNQECHGVIYFISRSGSYSV